MATIYQNDIKLKTELMGGWYLNTAITPVGIIKQKPNYGLYVFDTKIEKPMEFVNLEDVYNHIEDEFDLYVDSDAKNAIKYFISEYDE